MLCRSRGYRARGARCQFVGNCARSDIEPEPNINGSLVLATAIAADSESGAVCSAASDRDPAVCCAAHCSTPASCSNIAVAFPGRHLNGRVRLAEQAVRESKAVLRAVTELNARGGLSL